MIYNNTLHFLEHYDGAAWHDVCTIDGTQTLTNKTINGSNNTLSNVPVNSATGVLAIANGGTGSATVITTPTVTSWAGWDANKNFSENNLIQGFTTTVTAAGTTTLTVGSTHLQYFTGSTTQTLVMPVAATLVNGTQFKFVNQSSGNVTVQSSGGTSLQVMGANSTLFITMFNSAGGTGAGPWNILYFSAAANLTNPMTTFGDMIYGAASGTATRLPSGSVGQELITNSTSSAPYWSNPSNLVSRNVGIRSSVAANALTISLKQFDGATDPTSAQPVLIGFKTDNATNSGTTLVQQTSALSITVPANATLGQFSNWVAYVWVYAANDAGVMDLCVSGMSVFMDKATNVSTTISNTATSGAILYCASAHAGTISTRVIGRFTVTEVTPGLWAAAPTAAEVMPIPARTITEWVSYNPAASASFGTVTSQAVYSRRVGGNLEIVGGWTCGTTTAVAATMVMGFNGTASNVVSSTPLFNPMANGNYVGSYASDGARPANAVVVLHTNVGTSNLNFGTSAAGGLQASTGTQACGTGNGFSFQISVPVLSWGEFSP